MKCLTCKKELKKGKWGVVRKKLSFPLFRRDDYCHLITKPEDRGFYCIEHSNDILIDYWWAERKKLIEHYPNFF